MEDALNPLNPHPDMGLDAVTRPTIETHKLKQICHLSTLSEKAILRRLK